MNNINLLLGKISFRFDNPLFLLVLIPAVILAFWPYFRIRSDKRRTRNRIVSMILHLVILTLATFVLAGFTIHEDENLKQDETFILIDVSDSNYSNSDALVEYVNNVIGQSDVNNKVGIIVFGCGDPVVCKTLQSRPTITKQELFKYFDDPIKDDEGFIMTTGTDMANAIKFTETQFEDDGDYNGSKIIIFSDGLETDGNAENAAKSLASKGVEIDAVYFAPKDFSDSNEVQIQNVQVSNNSPKPNQAVDLTISLKAHMSQTVMGSTAKVEVFDLDSATPQTAIATDNFELSQEEEDFHLSVSFAEGGVHTIKLVMTPSCENDTNYTQNNVFYSYVVVQEKSNSILIIDGTGTGATDIKNLIDEKVIGESGYSVDVVSQANAPANISKYGEIILVNVNSCGSIASTGSKTDEHLPANYDVLLNNYVANGGGVLTTGGESTYYRGGMNKDAFSQFLPVSLKPEPGESKAVVFAIDYSSAMAGGEGSKPVSYPGASTYIELVKIALLNCLDTEVFSDNDYIGMIFFGGKTDPIKVLNITNSYNVVSIENALNFSNFPNGKAYMSNTEWRRPMEVAADMLNSFTQADNKHMIFITDGAGDKTEGESSALSGYPTGGWKYYGATIATGTLGGKCYTGYMYDKYEITTSTINILNTFPNVQNYVQQMATDGQGHYYYVQNPEEIVTAVDTECKNIPTKLVNTGKEYTMKLADVVTATTGVADDQLDVLKGFNGVSTKTSQGAYSLIDTDTNPIYAEWTYGKGKVGSLMTDVTSQTDWSTLATDTESKVVLKYLIDSCFKSSVSGLTTDMSVEFSQKNFTTTITAKNITNTALVPASGSSLPNGIIESYYHAPSSNIDPSKNSTVDYLCPWSADDAFWDTMNYVDSTFTSSFHMMEPGLYTVAFNRMNASELNVDNNNAPYNYVTFSYSTEYDTFYDATNARKKLEDICSCTDGGDVIYDLNESIFAKDRQYSSKDIGPEQTAIPMIIIALILFILDVCARKFHFLWPHELIKKWRGEKVGEEA